MTTHAKLVSVGVSKVRPVITGVVFRSKRRPSLVRSSMLKSESVAGVDKRPTASEKSDHLPVSRRRGLSVEGTRNNKQRPGVGGRHPASPVFVGEFQPQTECFEQGAIEALRNCDVGNAKEGM